MKVHSFFNHSFSILFSIIAAIIVGIQFKEWGMAFKPYGEIYIALLQLSVIPIIVTTISSSLIQLLAKNENGGFFKTLLPFLLLTIVSSTVSIVFGVLFKPWNALINLPEMNDIIAQSTEANPIFKNLNDIIESERTGNFIDFVATTIPQNLFASLSSGNVMQIIIFSILFGIGASYLEEDIKVRLKEQIFIFQKVFERINNIVLDILPLGLFFILSSQFTEIKISTITSLGALILTLISQMCFLMILFLILISIQSKQSIFSVIKKLKHTILITISTRSSFAAIPKSIEDLESLNFNRTSIELSVPFGVAVFRFGTICVFCTGALTVAGIFGTSLNISSFLFISATSAFAAAAAAGMVSISSLQMMSIVLTPLGLPLSSILVLFLAMDPIIDLFETLTTVLGNCAASASGSKIESKYT